VVPPGDGLPTEALLNRVRLAISGVPPGGTCSEDDLEALCAWRYAALARRSGSWQRLAARVPRQAICTAAAWIFDCICVIYKASSDALKVGLLGSLSCGSERIP